MAKITKTNTTNIDEDEKQLEFSYVADEEQNGTVISRKCPAFPYQSYI